MTTETSNARGEWVWVPRVPTEAMAETFRADMPASTYYTHTTLQCDDFASRYAAMLAAAPPPAAARVDVRGLVAKWRERREKALTQKNRCEPGTETPVLADWVREGLLKEAQAYGIAAEELESALTAEGVQAGEVDEPAVWYIAPDTGSYCADLETDGGQRQLSLLLQRDGKVSFAAYAHGQRFHGDATSDQFWQALSALAQQPAAVDGALDRMRQAPNRLWMADLVGQQISVERMRDILSFALATQHQEPTT